MKPRIPKTLPQPVPKVREGNSKAHLAMVKRLPCLVCGVTTGVDPHHLMRTGDPNARGMGMKAPDKYAVPACRFHHDAMHAAGNDEDYLASLGIDGRGLAASLWRYRGDPEGMAQAVYKARNKG